VGSDDGIIVGLNDVGDTVGLATILNMLVISE
jgi:hypothetical protein